MCDGKANWKGNCLYEIFKLYLEYRLMCFVEPVQTSVRRPGENVKDLICLKAIAKTFQRLPLKIPGTSDLIEKYIR